MNEDLEIIAAKLHKVADELDAYITPEENSSKSKDKRSKEDKGGLRKRTTIQDDVKDNGNKKDDEDTSKRLRRKNSKPLPGFYPHSHSAQSDDELDLNNFKDLELLDALKIKNFEGFYNLVFIMASFAMIYEIVIHVLDNGLQISFTHFTCDTFNHGLINMLIVAICILSIHLLLVVTPFSLLPYYGLFMSNKYSFSHTTNVFLYVFYQLILLFVPNVYLFFAEINPMCSALTSMMVVIIALKSHSYIFTNLSYYTEKQQYLPFNFKHYLYFILPAPTLVYETVYPMRDHIRKTYIVEKALITAGGGVLVYILLTQFIIPVFYVNENQLLRIAKIAVPSFCIWIIGFLTIFHGLLNLWAELIYWGDRAFYTDWWNTTSVDMYWKKWNIPVHEWCLRHVYVESQHYLGVQKPVAAMSTFFFSGIIHEIVCSVAMKTVTYYFFMGMIMQIPLIYLSEPFRGKRRGNFIMWLALFLGQPFLVVMYCDQFFAKYGGFWCFNMNKQ